MLDRESMNGILGSALEVANLGLRVHPLIGKQPLLFDWPTHATANPGVIKRMLVAGRNYGIICDKIAVIDTDTQELALWWRENMPKTPWMVQTPHGGMHFYYRSVAGLCNAVKAHQGWDVRAGGGGYVVGAGSIVDGQPYELSGEPTLALPPFNPAWLPKPREPLLLPKTSLPAEGRIRNLQAYTRKILSIQGQRGSDACFRVACILRDEGKTPEEAFELMLQWNETCAIPPWSVPELVKKIRDAYGKLVKGG